MHSSHALPMAYKGLMVDENSRVIDFYPTGRSCSNYVKFKCIFVQANDFKFV